jgi:hypothetical protein
MVFAIKERFSVRLNFFKEDNSRYVFLGKQYFFSDFNLFYKIAFRIARAIDEKELCNRNRATCAYALF